MKKLYIGAASAALAVGAMAGTANAQISQDGLVNVAADNVNVQIPIAAAADICGVAVNVLATAANFGDVDCTTSGVALADNPGQSSGPVRQRGLVNVALTDVNVQVPVSVAAAVCGVSVGVLAQAANVGDITCNATGVSLAD
jgi:hypothetical protein